jgi:hypothetical protein
MRRQVGRAQFHCLPIRQHRSGRITLVRQEISLQLPGLVEFRRCRNGCINQDHRRRQVAVACFQPGLAKQCRWVARLRRHGRRISGVGLLRLVLHQVSHRQRSLQVGLGLRRGQFGAGHFASHFVRLPQRQHAAREQRRHLVGRVFVALRLAQLNLGAGRITGLKQRLAQQKTRFRQIRFLLQSVLQLDGSRLGFVLGQVLLGRCEHGFWLLASTADQE